MPKCPNVPNWKDVNPRINVAYDLFGNGKTAIKASASRGRGAGLDPLRRRQQSRQHGSDDDVADVDRQQRQLLSRLQPAQFRGQDLGASGGDVCGAWLNLNFGNFVPATFYDPAIHERVGRAAVELGVLDQRPARNHAAGVGERRLLPARAGQLLRARTTRRSAPATSCPSASRCRPIRGCPTAGDDAHAACTTSGRTVVNRNVVKAASQFGNQYQHWNGVDVAVDARLRNGLFLQGGMSTRQAR